MNSLLCLCLALGLAGSTTAAPPSGESESIKGADLQLLDEVRRIAGKVARLRGQEFARPPLAVRVPDAMREVAAEIRAYGILSRVRMAARGRAWADVGLGGPETPEIFLRTLAADLEGVGFDPEGNRLLVSPERMTERDFDPSGSADDPATVLLLTGVRRDEPLFCHLLMHVRQRERAGADPLDPTTDRLLARMAWAEGEANLVAVRHLFAGLALADEVLTANIDPGEVLDGSLLPRGIEKLGSVEQALLRFVYDEGFAQAAERYRAGGWKALDRAMSRETTRALLHPERAGDPPAVFPEPVAPAIDGLRLADEDSLGEQAIVVLVSTATGKDNLGLMAGDGWVGDRLYRWEAGGGPGITEWITRWSSAEAAADFEYAYGRCLSARFGGSAFESADGGGKALTVSGRVFRVERRGSEVRMRIAPPDWDARLSDSGK